MKLLKSVLSLFALSVLTLSAGEISTDPNEARPLTTGENIPDVALQKVDGTTVKLTEITKGKKTALIFYRGSWCPYCNRHLASLADIEDDLKGLGVQLIAISPDKPEGLKEAAEKDDLSYTLLSDSSADAIKAFGLAFKLDEKTREKYKGYGIDLEKASGHDHFLLPVPAVYLVDGENVIQFVYFNPDYKNRLSPEKLLKAAEKL